MKGRQRLVADCCVGVIPAVDLDDSVEGVHKGEDCQLVLCALLEYGSKVESAHHSLRIALSEGKAGDVYGFVEVEYSSIFFKLAEVEYRQVGVALYCKDVILPIQCL